jgi:hypothetical protein
MCRIILSSNTHFGNIFSYTHIFQDHLNSHQFASLIKWFIPILLEDYKLALGEKLKFSIMFSTTSQLSFIVENSTTKCFLQLKSDVVNYFPK